MDLAKPVGWTPVFKERGLEHKAALAMFSNIPKVFVLETASFQDPIQKDHFVLPMRWPPGGAKLTVQSGSWKQPTLRLRKSSLQCWKTKNPLGSPENGVTQLEKEMNQSCILKSPHIFAASSCSKKIQGV